MNQELIDYIKKQRENGQADEQIKESLRVTGWNMEEVNATFGGKLSTQNNLAQTHQKGIRGWLHKHIGFLTVFLLFSAIFFSSIAFFILLLFFLEASLLFMLPLGILATLFFISGIISFIFLLKKERKITALITVSFVLITIFLFSAVNDVLRIGEGVTPIGIFTETLINREEPQSVKMLITRKEFLLRLFGF